MLNFPKLVIQVAIITPLMALISCFSARPWAGSRDFVDGLRCEMTEHEIAAIVQRFPDLGLHRPDVYPDRRVAYRGDTMIILYMEDSLLESYQISWTSGFTKQSSGLIHNLCSGEKYVELRFHGNEGIAGATVWLDDEPLGRLNRNGDFDLYSPLGVHLFRVEKAGVGSWSIELRYDESSSGYDILPFSFLTAEQGDQ